MKHCIAIGKVNSGNEKNKKDEANLYKAKHDLSRAGHSSAQSPFTCFGMQGLFRVVECCRASFPEHVWLKTVPGATLKAGMTERRNDGMTE